MYRKNIIIQFLILFLLNVFVTTGQTNRGAGNVKVKTDGGQTKEIKIYDGSYALVIGESDYTNGWDKLPGVKTDVAEVQSALERQGFNVETETNLTAEQFKARVDRFIGDYGYGANNRLLIYFAGHGHTQKSADGRDLGYIIPVDAPLPEKDELGFRRRAVSMDTIQSYARQIEAKHALFIFDSCFSGKLISRDKISIPPVIQENVAYPVRQFITAGAANQSVPDESVFRKAFVRGLDGEADRNGDGYITGSELADYLKEKVTNASDRTQTPQYGKIRDIDLERGDFIFVSPKGAMPIKTPGANVQPPNSDAVAKIEDQFWEAIKNSSEAEDFKFYKEKYPNGTYVNLADLKIRQLARPSSNGVNNSQSVQDNTPEKSFAQQEYERRLAEVQAKNREIEKSNAVVQNALNEGLTAYNQRNYDLAIVKFDEGIKADPDWAGSAVLLNNNKAAALRLRATGIYNQSIKDVSARAALLKKVKINFYESISAHQRAIILINGITDPAELEQYREKKYLALMGIAEDYRLLLATRADQTSIRPAIEALTNYEMVETDFSKKSKMQVQIADGLRETGSSTEAIKIYQKVVNVNPDDVDALAGIGISLVEVGTTGGNLSQKQNGLNYLQKFLDTAPANHKLRSSVQEVVEYLKTTERMIPRKIS